MRHIGLLIDFVVYMGTIVGVGATDGPVRMGILIVGTGLYGIVNYVRGLDAGIAIADRHPR